MQFNFILRFQNLNIVAIFEPQLCYCICKTNTRDGCILSNAESLFPLKIVFLQLVFSRSLQLCRVFPFPTGFSQLLGWAQGHSLVLQPDGSSHPRKPKWPENEMKQGSHPKTRKLGSYVHLAPTQDTLIHPSSCRLVVGDSSKKNRNDRKRVNNVYGSSSPIKYTVSVILIKTHAPSVCSL